MNMPIPTPCTKICALDALKRRCVGCGRTLDEIGRWSTMADAERLAIMARLKADAR
ncbi:DUF1289 domain-containing protein [Sphingobium sp. BS19]|uniref:DUF1289 domain-containing protein n=1 Tax=Sphingobium sp. BS19 TaxID=3018973 RepID=UPI00248FA11C|nr:DUF1289 domain-containing protein [Sphingobium sp. BS19]